MGYWGPLAPPSPQCPSWVVSISSEETQESNWTCSPQNIGMQYPFDHFSRLLVCRLRFLQNWIFGHNFTFGWQRIIVLVFTLRFWWSVNAMEPFPKWYIQYHVPYRQLWAIVLLFNTISFPPMAGVSDVLHRVVRPMLIYARYMIFISRIPEY